MRYSRLGIRAINEYRRVSPLTCLGLRHYLAASATLNDRWIEEVTGSIVRRQPEASYLASWQYKGILKNGAFEYRNLYYPGPNEALAESALLAACAEEGGSFSPGGDVYSYRLPPPSSKKGMFVPYFKFYAARQRAIGLACRQNPDDIVLYVDIEKFYPSVKQSVAMRAWQRACNNSNLDVKWRRLGEHLLVQSKTVAKGLLVGPVFSHLVGNLVLAGFDETMRRRFPGRFFRYVDDIALVIPADEKESVLNFINARLQKLNLTLNEDKHCDLPAREWVRDAPQQGDSYYDDDSWWMLFSKKIKCFLAANPRSEEELARAFRNEGFRIPVPRFRSASEESEHTENLFGGLKRKGFASGARALSVSELVADAKASGWIARRDFDQTWELFSKATKMRQKWLLSRLRHRLGRLISVAPDGEVSTIASHLNGRPEFAEFQALFDAMAKRDVSHLVRFSGKVNAAAGQALAASGQTVRCVPSTWSRESIEGYVTLLLQGVKLYPEPPARVQRRTAVRVVTGDFEPDDWSEFGTPFLRELAALSGNSSLERNCSLLNAPVDPDERWVLFADELQRIPS